MELRENDGSVITATESSVSGYELLLRNYKASLVKTGKSSIMWDEAVAVGVCVYHLFVHNSLGTIE